MIWRLFKKSVDETRFQLFARIGRDVKTSLQLKALSSNRWGELYTIKPDTTGVRSVTDHELAFTKKMGSSWYKEVDSCMASSPSLLKAYNFIAVLASKDVKGDASAKLLPFHDSPREIRGILRVDSCDKLLIPISDTKIMCWIMSIIDFNIWWIEFNVDFVILLSE